MFDWVDVHFDVGLMLNAVNLSSRPGLLCDVRRILYPVGNNQSEGRNIKQDY